MIVTSNILVQQVHVCLMSQSCDIVASMHGHPLTVHTHKIERYSSCINTILPGPLVYSAHVQIEAVAKATHLIASNCSGSN